MAAEHLFDSDVMVDSRSENPLSSGSESASNSEDDAPVIPPPPKRRKTRAHDVGIEYDDQGDHDKRKRRRIHHKGASD